MIDRARLIKALRKTRRILHGYACQMEADCLDACAEARDTIRDATGRTRQQGRTSEGQFCCNEPGHSLREEDGRA